MVIKETVNAYARQSVYLVKGLQERWGRHAISAYSAQMAYFFLLSIFPFLIVFLSLLGKMEITYFVVNSMTVEWVPQEALQVIDGFVKTLLHSDLETIVPLSLIASFWTSTKAFNAFEHALNTAFEVKRRRGYLKAKLMGLLMTSGLTVMLVVALTLPSMGSNFIGFLDQYVQLPQYLIQFLHSGRWIVMLMLFLSVLFSVYKWLPNVALNTQQVLPGMAFAMIGWWGLSYSFSIFVKQITTLSFLYGSLSAVISLMIWLYCIAVILMMGGEMNALLIDYKDEKKQ